MTQILVGNMCQRHQSLLVHQCGYGPNDAWRALIIVSQVALFQGCSADPKIQQKIGGEITRISTLGCLACQRPDLFGEVVEAGKKDLGDVKALGERWCGL